MLAVAPTIGADMVTVLAIALAVIDSACFAAAAVVQQRAVRHTVRRQVPVREEPHPRDHRLSLRGLGSLVRQRGWLAGVALMGLGMALHVLALALAPVSVVQPIGVLGVPLAVYLAARLDRHRPDRGARVPVTVCVIGVAAFVWLAASHTSGDHPVPVRGLLAGEVVLLAVLVGCAAAAHRVHGWRRCLLNALAGAAAIGTVAALMRAVFQHIQAGNDPLAPSTLAMAGILVVNGVLGAWLVQQAYASGRAEVVLACLTVVDPVIAVLAGLLLLGEGALLPGPILVGMSLCGLAAAGGVVALARARPGIGGSPAQATPAAVPATSQQPAHRAAHQQNLEETR